MLSESRSEHPSFCNSPGTCPQSLLQALADLLPLAYNIRAQTPECAGLADNVHAFKIAAEAANNAIAGRGNEVNEEETW